MSNNNEESEKNKNELNNKNNENHLDIIESIIDKRNNDYENDTEYKIKWKNQTLVDTWETLDNLINSKCFQLIFDYEEQNNLIEKKSDVKNFMRIFSEFNKNSPIYYKKNKSNFGNFPIDKPKQILGTKINKGNGERYYLIEWEERIDGVKPENSFIHSKVLAAFQTNFYIKYLENNCYY